MREEEQAYLEAVDVEDSYRFARKLEQYKTNEILGYRTAGSEAEKMTGEMIRQEMERMGLSNVRKESFCLDSWEFRKAVLEYKDRDGKTWTCHLGAYQTDFHTRGFAEYSLVYVGKGRAADYEGLDVKDKLVAAEINQREEWWINFPVYEAHIRGAAAFIAVQEGGFGEVDDTALNAQDIGGPPDAPAFSISRKDFLRLKETLVHGRAGKVRFLGDSTVRKDGESCNILGEIPGREPDSMILLSAHYDSYFSGFQDDNAAVGLMLGIGKGLLKSGYRPQKTLVFCALAAEEWGISDSKYDWSTGAWQQVSTLHPEWAGKVIADINFELPAKAHGKKDGIRSVYEYARFLESFVEGMKVDPDAYPEGITVYAPVETMSDDFSMAVSGIPSMVNDFTSGQFMETHYHSQFDNKKYYEEPVYRFHHQLYGRLVMAFDRTAIAPLDYERLFLAMAGTLDLEFSERNHARGKRLKELVEEAAGLGKKLYEWIRNMNETYASYLDRKEYKAAARFRGSLKEEEKLLLEVFRKEQDSFVRLNWHDEVIFPHEAARINLRQVQSAIVCLEAGDGEGALEAVYEIDNNRYAFQFDQQVFDHFTEYVMNQEPERLQWGAGRILRHENLFSLVQSLKARTGENDPDFTKELETLRQVEKNQMACYVDDIEYMIHAMEKIIGSLKETEGVSNYGKRPIVPGTER